MEAVKANLHTEFHPSGTTAMMPLALGGVVNTELLVYGTDNVRVVDAGVMPLIPGAHLQAGVYAVAERAADIIKEADRHRVVTSGRPTGGGGGQFEPWHGAHWQGHGYGRR